MLLNAQAKNPLADAIRRETHNKKRNYNIIITGKPQSGKSVTAVALALGIRPKFSLENDMAVIDAGKLLNILKNNIRKYSVILADDFGMKGSSGIMIAIVLLLIMILIVMLFGFGFVEMNGAKMGW